MTRIIQHFRSRFGNRLMAAGETVPALTLSALGQTIQEAEDRLIAALKPGDSLDILRRGYDAEAGAAVVLAVLDRASTDDIDPTEYPDFDASAADWTVIYGSTVLELYQGAVSAITPPAVFANTEETVVAVVLYARASDSPDGPDG